MTERLEGEVLHAIPPEELGDHELQPELRELAESHHVFVCRRGGHPSMFGLFLAYLRRDPIEAVTVIADTAAEEGDSISVIVEETSLTGVYRVV